MISDIVIGLQFGDEGKGKVVYQLVRDENYDLCIRFNGGPNAGHSIYYGSRKVVLHMIPCGILNERTSCYIASNCVVDKEKIQEEIRYLKEEVGISMEGRLFISEAVHLITPENVAEDWATNKIGTTGSGIGPTYSKKALRTGARVGDERREFEEMGFQVVNPRTFLSSYSNSTKILCEGAQGFELDINWTRHYPYCTSSSCTVGAAIDCGIPLLSVRHIYGVAKIYETYVGTMEFQQADNRELEMIQEKGCEFGSTTGRKRQCQYLNLDRLKEAMRINSINRLIVNKCDVLKECGFYKLYHHNLLLEFGDLDEMKRYICEQISIHQDHIIFSESPYFIEEPKLRKKLSYQHIQYEPLNYIM